MSWLVLFSYSSSLKEGTWHDAPTENAMWYHDGTVYKVRSDIGPILPDLEEIQKVPVPINPTHEWQFICDMINDLPLEVLPKYIGIGREGFKGLVLYRLSKGK